MEQIDVGNGIKLLLRNPNDWFRETVTINLSGGNNGYKPKKERAEFVSGISYPETIELGQSDVEQLSLFSRMPYTFDSSYLNSFKRKGETKIISRGLSSGKVFSSRLHSLDDVVTGSEIFGVEDLKYMLFESGDESRQRFVEFLDLLNMMMLRGLIKGATYVGVLEKLEDTSHKVCADLWNASWAYKRNAIPIHRKMLMEELFKDLVIDTKILYI